MSFIHKLEAIPVSSLIRDIVLKIFFIKRCFKETVKKIVSEFIVLVLIFLYNVF